MKPNVDTMENNVTVEVFKGKEASVNSYLFSNGESMIVMDVLRNSKEAEELAAFIKAKALPLTHILITHGHPDHYIGMHCLKQHFPVVRIVVASEAIKQDIIGFSTWMESIGWLDGEPALKPKSDQHPDGFDYEREIAVLEEPKITLDGGGTLEIKSDYNGAEAEHLTTVYSQDLNALFTSDFCYNEAHPWLGQGVDAAHIANWKAELKRFKAAHEGSDMAVYPGHGDRSDFTLFDKVLSYIEDFERVIENATTEEEAMTAIQELYPSWEQADFLLLNSVNYHMGLKQAHA